MKKSKIISISILLLAIPMLFMVSGCKKFLDRKPLTATLDDLKQGGIEGQVFGIYSAIKDYDIGQVFGGIPWQGMHNFRSDDSQKGSEPSDGAEWVAPFDNFQYVKDLWASNFYWDAHYSLIHLTNTALKDSFGKFKPHYGCVIKVDGNEYQFLSNIPTEKEQHKPSQF